MVNGINFNGQNNWVLNTNTVRYNAVPTSLWSYDLSCMAPQDSLGTLNDIGLFNFDIGVNNLVNQTAALNANILPYLTAFQANISAQNQQIMSLLSRPATPNMFLSPFNNAVNNTVNNNTTTTTTTYKDKIDESDVATYIGKLGNDPKWKDALGAKIKLADGTETTILQRLVDLCHDYLTNEDPELSAEEFAQIQEIAGKYGKTGKISREEFLTLKKIVEAHTGKKADPNGADGDKIARPDKYQAVLDNAEAGSPNNYKQLSNYFKDILYNGDATEDSLNEGTKLMDKYNVLNVVQHFKNEYGHLEEENIIDAIFADTSRWGNVTGLNWMTDDAKPSVTRISELLIDRTNDIIEKNPQMSEEDKNALKAKSAALSNALANTTSHSDSNKKAISAAFQDLADSLEKVENSIYGEVE